MQTSLKLYYAPQSRAVRSRWALEEAGVPYELVRMDLSKKEQKQPEYLRIHPLGVVPALVDGETSIIESVAICMHVADRFPEKKLAPPLGSVERGLYYQWCMFVTATFEQRLVQYLSHTRWLPDAQQNPELADAAKKQLGATLQVVNDALEGRDYLVGSAFSMADVVVGSGLIWASLMGIGEGYANVQRYNKQLMQRPGFMKAYAD
jgi:glutathione S-transferase